MKFRLFYIAIFFVVFLVGVSGADRVRVFAYEPQITVGDVALPDVSVPEYVSEKSLPPTAVGVLPLAKVESAGKEDAIERLAKAVGTVAARGGDVFARAQTFLAGLTHDGAGTPTASADIITLTNRATREFLANVIARADQFAADFSTSDSARAALTSQTVGKVRVTTLRASLADLIAPQITVGEVVVPDLSVPQFLTEPFESRNAVVAAAPQVPAEGDSGTTFLDRMRDTLARLIAGQRLPARTAATTPVTPQSDRASVSIPTTVLPTAVRVPEFVSETSFRAVPPPVAPAPREVVIVERHALPSSSDLAPASPAVALREGWASPAVALREGWASPAVALREGWVAANLSAQIGSIARALQTLAAQRNADRSELLKMISDTNNVGRLPSVTLSSPTISGTVSGLTDASIPDDITINTSGTINSSATFGTSTLAANFAAGTTTVSGIIRVNGTGATSTFAANVDVSGNLRIGGTCISCGGVSTIAGWTDSGILVELQTTSDLVAIGTSTPVSGAVVTVEATSTGAIPLALRGYTGQAADFFRILNASGNRLMFVSSTGGIFSSSTLQAATTTIYGNLGVGTTSPTEQFSVAGRLYVGGTGTSTFENNLQVLGQLKIGTSSAYITDTQISGTSNFTISTQGENNHLVLQTLGRIGVVSTTPWGVFSVEHNGANQNMPVFVIADEGTSTPTMVVDWAGKIMAGTSTPRGWFTINDRGGADTFVVGSNTPRFIVKGGGNVGVGTTSPYALFSVGGNAALGTTTLYGSLTLGSASDDPAGPTNGQLYYSTTDGAIRAYTNNTWGPLGGGFTRNSSTGIISLFNASDRLTIGTTSPAGLSLITAEATSTAAIPLTLRGYTAQAANLLQIVNSSGTNLLFVNASGGVFASSSIQSSATSTFYAGLGVGTTSPTAQLSVAGNLYVAGPTTTLRNISYGWPSADGTNGQVLQTNGSGVLSWAQGSQWTTLGNNIYYTTGNVGIGTTSPGALLSIHGNALISNNLSVAGITATGTITLANLAASASSTIDGLYVRNATTTFATTTMLAVSDLASTSRLTVSSSFVSTVSGTSTFAGAISTAGLASSNGLTLSGGALFASSALGVFRYLGVSTSTPGSTFAVHGNALVSGDLSIANLVASGTINVTGLASFANATATNLTAVTLTTTGTTTTGGLVATSSVYLATVSGRVGISTTAPFAKLEVVETASSTTATALALSNLAGATNTAARLVFNTQDVVTSATTTAAITGLLAQNFGAGLGDLVFATLRSGLLTEGLRLTGGGFLGVGTSSPGALLSIHGNALVSNNLSVANLTATGTVTTANLAASASSTIDGLYVRAATTTYATTTDLVVTGRLLANTASSTITNLTTTNATATVLTVSDIASTSRLTVSSSFASTVSGTSTFTGGISSGGLASSNGLTLTGGALTAENILISLGTTTLTNLAVTNMSTSTFAGGFAVQTNRLVVSQVTGAVGVGTTTPTVAFAVQGNLLISGNLTSVADFTATGTVTTANLAASASSTIDGLYVRAATTTYATTTDLVVTGRLLANTASSTITNLTTTNATATVFTVSSIASTSRLVVSSNSATSTFTWGISTGGLSSTNGLIISGGSLGVGTTSPYARLSITGASGSTQPLFVVASSSNATEYFSISSTGTTTIQTLQTGAMTFETNAGAVTWVDLPVTSSAAQQTAESYSAQLDTTDVLTIYGESDGLGGIWRPSVGIGTSTPWGIFSIEHGSIPTSSPVFVISDQGTSSPSFIVLNSNGFVGVATATPGSRFSVHGNALVSNNLLTANLTATGTITTANLAASASSTIDGLYVRAATTTYATTTDLVVTGRLLANTASSTITNLTTTNATATVLTVSDIASTSRLTVSSSFTSTVSGTSTFAGGVSTAGLASSNGLTITGGAFTADNILVSLGTTTLTNLAATNMSTSTFAGGFAVQTNRLVVRQVTGNVGVGTTTPTAAFAVHGNALISGDIASVANVTATGTVTTANLAVSASSTIDGLYVRNATTTFATTTNLVVTGGILANTASSTITNLTTTNATATVLTVSSIASTSRLVVSSNSATSTFTWGIQAMALNITGTATSTFANGIDISKGCFSINNTCVGGGSGTVNSGTTGQLTFYASDAATVSGTSTIFISTGSLVGIGSSTPWAKLSVQGIANGTAPVFAVGTSTGNANLSALMVAGSGKVGIGGTTTPQEALSVRGNIANTLESSETNPTLVGSTSISINPQAIYVSGKYAYVTNLVADTLEVFDISTSSPAQIGSAPAGTNPGSIYVSGRYAYVLSVNTIRVFDISTSTPALTGFATTDTTPIDLFVSGRYAYVVNTGSDTLQVFDISTSTPALIGSAITNDAPQAVYISGRYAYVVTDSTTDTLQIFDISTSSPARTGSANTGAGPKSVSVSGRYAYVVNNSANTLQVFDVSTTSPALIGSVSTGASSGPYSVSVSGRYAYVHTETSNKLEIFDISSPTAPALVGSAATGNHIGLSPHSIFISGRYAYVANGTDNSFQVFDVSGLETTSAIVHSLEAGNLQVRNDITAQGQLQIKGGLNVGAGGIYSAGSLSVNATSTFLGITAGGLEIDRGGLCVDDDGTCTASTSGRISAVSYVTGATDLAENYYSDEQLQPGEVVVSLGGANVGRSAQVGDKRALGVVSTQPGIILGLDNDGANQNLYPIALTGRVPVKVNLQGGPVEVGDPITLSSELGVGMKATATSMVLGYALEAFYGASTTIQGTPSTQPSPEASAGTAGSGTKTILMFAKVGQWNAPAVAEAISPIGQISPIDYVAQALSAVKDWLTSMGVVIEQSVIKVKEIVVDMLTAKRIVTDQLQMKDKFTGEAYCVELVNGDLVRTKGECAAPVETVNSVPTPDASAPLSTSQNAPINTEGSPSTQPSPEASAGAVNSGTNDFSATTTATSTEATTTTELATTTTVTLGEPVATSTTDTTEVATTTP